MGMPRGMGWQLKPEAFIQKLGENPEAIYSLARLHQKPLRGEPGVLGVQEPMAMNEIAPRLGHHHPISHSLLNNLLRFSLLHWSP